jgi:hypothetical protein
MGDHLRTVQVLTAYRLSLIARVRYAATRVEPPKFLSFERLLCKI